MNITTQWLIRSHLPAVAQLDRQPCSEHAYRRFLSEPHNGGIVATDGCLVYGFALYCRYPDHIYVEKFAVCEREAAFVESLLMLALKKKVIGERMFAARIVHEADLGEQLQFHRHDFDCIDIWREFFEDGDAYLFRWLRPIAPTEPAMGAKLDPCGGVNRIAAVL